jgi:phage tail tape-measure protein
MSNETKAIMPKIAEGALTIEKEHDKTTISIDPSPKGAVAGVAAGATVGAVLGPVGAAAGAVIGGTIGAIFGKK